MVVIMSNIVGFVSFTDENGASRRRVLAVTHAHIHTRSHAHTLSAAGSLNLKPAREYRHNSGEKRHEEERAEFEKRIALLEKGYVSKLTLDSFTIGRTLGEGAFGRVVFAQVKPTAAWPDKDVSFVAIKCMGKKQVRPLRGCVRA